MQLLVYRMLSKLFSLSCFTTYSLFFKKNSLSHEVALFCMPPILPFVTIIVVADV